MTQTNPDPYALLGVTPAATPTEVNQAFRTKLRTLQPDTRSAAPDTVDDTELRLVLEAYVRLRQLGHLGVLNDACGTEHVDGQAFTTPGETTHRSDSESP